MNLLFSNTTTFLATVRPRGFWMPEQASSFAGSIDAVFMFITWLSIFFFVLITILAIWFAYRYRRPSSDHTPNTNAATHNTPLELTWTIIPLILVIIIFYVGMLGYVELRSPPAETYDVQVTARKWSWTFEHPNGAIENEEVHLPQGQPVRFIMSSEDVLHSVFIPAFRVKQDVVPGRFTTLWFQAERAGQFDLFCAEYCGTQHATMYAVVTVLPQDEFDEKIVELAEWLDDVPEDRLHIAGADRRLTGVCLTCHTVDGSPLIGPSFRETHELWGQERTMSDGTRKVVDENYIAEMIQYPNRYTVEGYPAGQMPNFQLRDRQMRAIVEFIKRLDEFELDDRGRPIQPNDQ